MVNKKYLTDKTFLRLLDRQKHSIKYAKIILLNLEEQPLEEITGIVKSGSISIDGASSIRRTCNLSLIAQDREITNVLWALGHKFSLEVGVENTINSQYPDIIWFPEGIYGITSFNCSKQANDISISISGKDKMSYLNGDLGGIFTETVILNKIDIATTDPLTKEEIYKTEDIDIYTLIQRMLQKYAHEPLSNIIINDLPDHGLELLDYQGRKPREDKIDTEDLYLILPINGHDNISELADAGMVSIYNEICYLNGQSKRFSEVSNDPNAFVQASIDSEQKYIIQSFSKGQAAGYKKTELTYPDELKAEVGSNITTILDKIKNFLGDFEYFYDLQGRFVFQRKKTYINQPWNPISLDGKSRSYVLSLHDTSDLSYSFSDSELITSISNNPDINTIKNDFCIYGTRKGVSGKDIPIRLRFSLHKKPYIYISLIPYWKNKDVPTEIIQQINKFLQDHHITNIVIPSTIKFQNCFNLLSNTALLSNDMKQGAIFCLFSNNIYFTTEFLNNTFINEDYAYFDFPEKEPTIKNFTPTFRANFIRENYLVDWRELIYEMANDYTQYGSFEEFRTILATINKWNEINTFPSMYYDGLTHYEQYYTDMLGFWRQLYDPFRTQEFEIENVAVFNLQMCQQNLLNISQQSAKSLGAIKEDVNSIVKKVKKLDAEKIIKDIKNMDFQTFQKYLGTLITKVENIAKKTVDFIIPQKALDTIQKTAENIGAEGVLEDVKNAYIKIKGIVLNPKLETSLKEIPGASFVDSVVNEIKKWDNRLNITTEAGRIINTIIGKLPNNINIQLFAGTEETWEGTQLDFLDYIPPVDTFWLEDVSQNPEKLNFWIDFFECTGTIYEPYSVPALGFRTKTVKDSKVKSISYKEVPTVLYYFPDELQNLTPSQRVQPGYTVVQIQPSMTSLFSLSTQGKSAINVLDELMCNNIFGCNKVSINAVPIYYLEPNTRILIKDKELNIDEEYLVDKISLPLGEAGTMSISAVEALDRIY